MHFPTPLLATAAFIGLLGRTMVCVQYGVSFEEIGYHANGNIVDNSDEVCKLNGKPIHSPELAFSAFANKSYSIGYGDETGWGQSQ